jgi:hypothetical protein
MAASVTSFPLSSASSTFASSSSASFSKFDKYYGNLSTDEDRIHYLLGVKALLPALSENTTAYSVSLLDLLRTQEKLIASLIRNPQYREVLTRKRNLLEITIAPKTNTVVKSYQIEEESVVKWKELMLSTYRGLRVPKNGSALDVLRSKIADILNQTNGQSPEQLVEAVAQLVPIERRKEIFNSADLEKKLELLNSYLPARFSGFRNADRFGIKPDSSRAEALARIRKLNSLVQKLKNLTLLYGVICDEVPKDAAFTADQLKHRLSQIGSQEVKAFAEKRCARSSIDEASVRAKRDGQEAKSEVCFRGYSG